MVTFKKRRNQFRKKFAPTAAKKKARFAMKQKKIAGEVKRTKGKDMIIYKDPKLTVLPQEYITKVRARGQGYLTLGDPIPTGFNNSYYWYFNGLTINNLWEPFTPLQTAAIKNIDGLNWSSNLALQPIGFQTLCNALTYGRYQVLATKIKLRMLPTNGSDRIHVVMAPLQIGTGGAPPVNITQGYCLPWSKSGDFSHTNADKTMTLYVDHAKYLGIDPKVYRTAADGLYDAVYNGNPTQLIGLHISAATADHANLIQSIGFELEFTYYCRFFELRNNLML